MVCANCNNKNAYRMRFYSGGIQVCDNCGLAGSSHVYDVYWDGRPEETLADDPRTGNPRVFASRGEKAAYLRERGLMEAGDKVHGAPVSSLSVPRRTNSRDEVKMALKQVKEMGIDRRRQEYLRITKEGYRAKR